MSDDLRTRIAQAVCQEYFDREDVVWQTWRESYNADPEYWFGYADAVIRELGLHEETMHNPNGAILTRLDGKVLADNRYMRRWATNWEADESPVK